MSWVNQDFRNQRQFTQAAETIDLQRNAINAVFIRDMRIQGQFAGTDVEIIVCLFVQWLALIQ